MGLGLYFSILLLLLGPQSNVQSQGSLSATAAWMANLGLVPTYLHNSDQGNATAEGPSKRGLLSVNEAVLSSWGSAPACNTAPSPLNSVTDDLNRRWGWTSGVSCAFRSSDLSPVLTWSTAPRCTTPPNLFIATSDTDGRLWGFLDTNQPCRFSDAAGQPIFDWLTAHVCPHTPTTMTAEYDESGRLWGWHNSTSCAYRLPDGRSMLMGSWASAAATDPDHGAVTWASAARCKNTLNNTSSNPDLLGRRWGWEAGSSCAYKDAAGRPRYTFATAPQCSDLTQASSPPDADSHVWASDYSCAFKTTRNVPLTTWAAAPMCASPPLAQNAVVDFAGRLWGWSNGKACKYTGDVDLSVTVQTRRALLALTGWSLAPACTQLPVTQYTKDSRFQWLLWGYEDGHSCAFRDAAGNGLSQYDIVVACTTQAAMDRAVPDASGRRWGWEDGHSCKVASPSPSPPSPIPVQQQPTTQLASKVVSWDTAPACTGFAPADAAVDANGRLWGWMNGASCAYRGSSTTPSSSNSPSSSAGCSTPSDVLTLASCSTSPDMAAAHIDVRTGYLWGCEQSKACAYRFIDASGNPLPIYYASLITGGDYTAQPNAPQASSKEQWMSAPRCSQPPTWSTGKPDDGGRLWGYENGSSCVFRDYRGYPVFTSDLSSVASYYNAPQSWETAPICMTAPTYLSARADAAGRLWGFNSRSNSSCAYKDASGNPVYPASL